MNRTTVVLALFTACLITADRGVLSTTLIAQQQSPAEQQLIQAERDWCTALLKKDAALLGRILADEFSAVTSRGLVQNKADSVADLNDKSSITTACVDRDIKVRVYGETAVVTGIGSRSGTFKGEPYKDRQLRWTDTFVKRDGRWQCVASQGTLITQLK